MSSPYLPAWATAQEASDWLQAETGQQWPLSRLLETAHEMSVWIDCHDDEPEHIVEHVFQGRREGFRAPVTFGSDIARLAFVKDGGTLCITRRPDETLLKISPPMRFAVEELRFEAACLKRLAALSATPVLSSVEMPTAMSISVPTSNRLINRTGALDAVIELAERQALDPTKWQSVWDELVAIGLRDNRPAPLIGYVESEGVKYRVDDPEKPVRFLTREAFRKRHTLRASNPAQ